jgi:hypothetical protein
MKAQSRSIRWAEGISWISACPTDGSPLAFTSRVLSASGDERADGFGLTGQECRGSDLREQPGGGMQQFGRGDGAGCLALEQAHQLVHQLQLALRGGTTAQVLQCNAGQTRQVPGQQARGFLGIQLISVIEIARQLAQLLLQALGEELLVEAGGWGLVGHGVAWLMGFQRLRKGYS